MKPPQYTTCVDRDDYVELNLSAETIAIVAALVLALPLGPAAVIAALPVAIPVAISAMLKICDYLLNGKLVCLGGDRCAIGRITAFETVAQKSGEEKLDNDFSINIMLAPHQLADFATGGDKKANYDFALTGPQGELIREQADMPLPREPNADGGFTDRYRPTTTTFPDSSMPSFSPGTAQNDLPFHVPIFHTEIEGERTRAVCEAIRRLSGLGIPGLCGWKPLGIPIGRVICIIVGTILFPVILAAIVTAWFAGSDDNRDFQNAGQLQRGECVVINGRWVYDAGHAGYNEIHAVKRIQKLPPGSCSQPRFQAVWNRWCQRTDEVPPVPVEGPDPTPADMTPEQEGVWNAQLEPVNRWVLHPLLDGCEEQEPIPVPK